MTMWKIGMENFNSNLSSMKLTKEINSRLKFEQKKKEKEERKKVSWLCHLKNYLERQHRSPDIKFKSDLSVTGMIYRASRLS